MVDTLAADATKALSAIDAARAATRAQMWSLAGQHAPNHAASVDDPIVMDLDATLLTSHSDKEQAALTFKRGFGSHPLLSSSITDRTAPVNRWRYCRARATPAPTPLPTNIAVTRAAFAQLPRHRPGRRPSNSVFVRTDGAGCTHAFVQRMTGQRVQYSIGFALPTDIAAQLKILDQADVWSPALDAEQQLRPNALVAEATGLLDLSSWPTGMRVIIRKESPTPARSNGSPTSTAGA